MSHSMIDNSAVCKALAVRFRLLDRACVAAHSADIGFSKYCSSPVLHRLKGAADGFYMGLSALWTPSTSALWRVQLKR
jgi:hypothetical protein